MNVTIDNTVVIESCGQITEARIENIILVLAMHVSLL